MYICSQLDSILILKNKGFAEILRKIDNSIIMMVIYSCNILKVVTTFDLIAFVELNW